MGGEGSGGAGGAAGPELDPGHLLRMAGVLMPSQHRLLARSAGPTAAAAAALAGANVLPFGVTAQGGVAPTGAAADALGGAGACSACVMITGARYGADCSTGAGGTEGRCAPWRREARLEPLRMQASSTWYRHLLHHLCTSALGILRSAARWH